MVVDSEAVAMENTSTTDETNFDDLFDTMSSKSFDIDDLFNGSVSSQSVEPNSLIDKPSPVETKSSFLPTLNSPFDHIRRYFSDLLSQVVALNSEYCGRTCKFSHTLTKDGVNGYCDRCSCRENCMESNNCCPDILLLQKNQTQTSFLNSGCVESELPVTEHVEYYQMITWCPDSYNISSVNEKCENPSYTSWTNVVPHFNSDTGISYRNIYCARCHGQNSTRTWMTSITCSSFDTSLESASLSEIFAAVMKSKVCSTDFTSPKHVEKLKCNRRKNGVIGQCNVTGRWPFYDRNVDVACSMFSQVVFGTYRNIFCYYCNTHTNWEHILNVVIPDQSKNPMSVPLTALINFDTVIEAQNAAYAESVDVEINDKYSNLSISCAEGKRLINDECHSLFTSSNMYGYRVCFQVNVTIDRQLTSETATYLIMKNMPRFDRSVLQTANFTGYIVQLQNCPRYKMYAVMRQVFFIYTVSYLNRDQFEKELLGGRLIQTDPSTFHRFHAGCNNGHEMALTKGDPFYCTGLNNKFVYKEISPVIEADIKVYEGARYIQLSKQLVCPRVKLSDWEYNVSLYNDKTGKTTQHGNTKFPTLTILITGTVLNHQDFQILDDGSIVVCLEDYVNATFHAKYSNKHKLQETQQNILGIFSFVCSSISLLFLALTFITYCFFPSMRTVGGVCNMCLVATVFAAQAVFEYGIEQNEDAIGCQVIGIIIHFLWLAAVFWMNACTFVLFLKLSFPLKCRNFDQSLRKIVLLSALYSYGVSALIVTLNIITNFALHSQIGYGGIICYLNNTSSKTYFFKIPMGVIVLVNIGLFVFTLCNVRRHGSVNSTRESKINMFACFKLSSTTGLFWLFSYLYEVFQIEVFAYVFTIFVGLQGVLFFVAIVVNRNVLSLWSRRLRDKKDHVHTNSTTSTERLTSSSKHSHDYELTGNPVDDKQ